MMVMSCTIYFLNGCNRPPSRCEIHTPTTFQLPKQPDTDAPSFRTAFRSAINKLYHCDSCYSIFLTVYMLSNSLIQFVNNLSVQMLFNHYIVLMYWCVTVLVCIFVCLCDVLFAPSGVNCTLYYNRVFYRAVTVHSLNYVLVALFSVRKSCIYCVL